LALLVWKADKAGNRSRPLELCRQRTFNASFILFVPLQTAGGTAEIGVAEKVGWLVVAAPIIAFCVPTDLTVIVDMSVREEMWGA